jgi:hypothetical protein
MLLAHVRRDATGRGATKRVDAELAAEAHDDLAATDVAGDLHGLYGGDEGLRKQLGRDALRWRQLIRDGVGTEHTVQVHGASTLELDTFHVREANASAELWLGGSHPVGEVPEGVDRDPPPQLAHAGVEEDTDLVVEAL